jgi:hypothetical protein
MPKLFSNSNKKFLIQIDKPEKELNKFICENWKNLFPSLNFIASEVSLKGNVRSLGNNGRIDILAYNPETKKFVIFELKKDYDKNITDQAADYRDYVQDNFSDIYLHATQKYDIELPKFTHINQNNVEIILIAKKFSLTQIERVKKIKENTITLIKYFWFEDDLIFIDYINNDPDDIKIESINTKKVKQIGEIANQDPDIYEIDRYFNLKQEAKELFTYFYNFLKTKGEITLEPQQVVMKVRFKECTFSVIGLAGKGGNRKILQINTNINVTTMNNGVRYEDRIRPGQKKKGSLGTERFEVYIRNEDDMKLFCNFIGNKL